MQDDATLLGYDTSKSAESAMAEARYLGVDMVRAFVSWSKASPNPRGKQMPAGLRSQRPQLARLRLDRVRPLREQRPGERA